MRALPCASAMALLAAMSSFAYAQPNAEDGLPGKPVTSTTSAKPKEAAKSEESEKSKLTRAATAVADYLTRSFVEDAGITADGWLSWGKPSKDSMPVDHSRRIRVRIKTAKLEAEFDDAFDRTDGVTKQTRRELIKFKDMIGKTIVEVGFDGERQRDPNGTDVARRNDAHALGWQFNEQNTIRFEMTLKQDDATSTTRRAYRAILKTTPFKNSDENKTFVRIGLERVYNAPRHKLGETSGVLGLEHSLGKTWDARYLRLKTTIEVTGGARDEKVDPADDNRATLGAVGRMALETGGKNWDASLSAYQERNRTGLGFDNGSMTADHETIAHGITLKGEWRFNEGRHKLYTTLDSSVMKTVMKGIEQDKVWRNKAELGIEFNDRWRFGVNGTYDDFGRGRDDWQVGFTVGFKFGGPKKKKRR